MVVECIVESSRFLVFQSSATTEVKKIFKNLVERKKISTTFITLSIIFFKAEIEGMTGKSSIL